MIAWLIAATLFVLAGQVEDDAPLGLADLAAEHAALTGKSDASGPPQAVAFRDLWDRPDAWRGRRVIVRGRVARVFRQAAVGSFPPLVEAWIEEPPGNLFCAVFASGATDAPAIASGASVAFTGTFLRRVRYAADDGGRLAPLIVGAEPPRIETRARAKPRDFDPQAAVSVWSDSTWAVGLFIGLAGIALILAWRTLNRPATVRERGRSAASEPEPEFFDHEREPADGDSR
ncbi:MAG: hypothetical protein P4L85_25635 [Paludisphaera borealis]|uniref:hypothetical protein n=1 Tax=Paludisphaera borealis TaxID=1387353 RepID=UPI002840FD63|nr:hypothetical protein [Paludisphaera borealis]MDR3622761.1 hypothetical protein [Paludisphaera borealis]